MLIVQDYKQWAHKLGKAAEPSTEALFLESRHMPAQNIA